MSRKQENLINTGTPTSKVDNSSFSKAIVGETTQTSFVVSPRLGGYLKLVVPSSSKNFTATLAGRHSSFSKGEPFESNNELRIKSGVESENCSLSSKRVTINSIYFSKESERHSDETEEDDSLSPEKYEIELNSSKVLPNNMLAITISCVMLMASKVQAISDEYLTWAEHYLTCIKDKNGNHPTNIQGILNHIMHLRTKQLSRESSVSKIRPSSFIFHNRSRSSSLHTSDIRHFTVPRRNKKKLKTAVRLRNIRTNKKSHTSHVTSMKNSSSFASFATSFKSVQKTK